MENVEIEEPLEKPKRAKRVYSPEEIEIMKANLQRGRDAKKKAQEDRVKVLELHEKLVEKKSKAQELAEVLEKEIENVPVATTPITTVVKKEKKVKQPTIIKKLPSKKQEQQIINYESDSSVEIIIEKKPKQKRQVIYVEKPEPQSQMEYRPILRFV